MNARKLDGLWGGLGLIALLLGWSWVHASFGDFVLPSLSETLHRLWQLIASGDAGGALATTLIHAGGGAVLAILIGFLVGLAGGMIRPLGAGLLPAITAILGVPPIAWVVLTLMWFGPGRAGPLFTVVIATMPIAFAATLQGVKSRNRNLDEMAEVFRIPPRDRFLRVLLPSLAVPLAPALSTVLALSWKVALTAELLGDGTGVGGRFASARTFLDLPEAMAWIVLVVIFVLATDGVLLGALRRWIDIRTGRQAPDRRAAMPTVCACPSLHSGLR